MSDSSASYMTELYVQYLQLAQSILLSLFIPCRWCRSTPRSLSPFLSLSLIMREEPGRAECREQSSECRVQSAECIMHNKLIMQMIANKLLVWV